MDPLKDANTLDLRGIGAIKAWFSGTRTPLQTKNRKAPFTWAIFSDTNPTGQVERKFITEALARPGPLVVAGRLESYGYDFASRTPEVRLKPDAKFGSTEIFVPAERHYLDGFRIEVGEDLGLALKPGEAELSTAKSADDTSSKQAGQVHCDADSQHVIKYENAVNTQGLPWKVLAISEEYL